MKQYKNYDRFEDESINLPLMAELNEFIYHNMEEFKKPQRSILMLSQIYIELHLVYSLKKFYPELTNIDEDTYNSILSSLLDKTDSGEMIEYFKLSNMSAYQAKHLFKMVNALIEDTRFSAKDILDFIVYNDDYYIENNSYREGDGLDYDFSFYNLLFNVMDIKDDDNILLDSSILPYSYAKFIMSNENGKNAFVDRINKLPIAAYVMFRSIKEKFGEDKLLLTYNEEDVDIQQYNKRFYIYNYNVNCRLSEFGLMVKEPLDKRTFNSSWIGLFKAVYELEDNTKSCVVVPRNILSSASSEDNSYREYLIQNGYIESIIGFGEKVTVYPDSNVPVAIIVLSKGNSKVNIVEAAKLGSKTTKKVCRVKYRSFSTSDVDKILELIGTNTHGVSHISHYNDILTGKWPFIDLNPNVVVTLDRNTFVFGDCIQRDKKARYEIQRGRQIRSEDLSKYISDTKTKYQILKVDNLKEGYLYFDNEDEEVEKGCYLNLTEYEFKNIFSDYTVDDGDMLMSKSAIPYLQTAILDRDLLPESKRDITFIILDGLYTVKLYTPEDGYKYQHNPYYIQHYLSSREGREYTNYYATGWSFLRFISKKNVVCLEIPYVLQNEGDYQDREEYIRLNYIEETKIGENYKNHLKQMIALEDEYYKIRDSIAEFKLD